MRAILKEPGKRPEYIDIQNTLEALQEKVGGYIETVTFAADLCVVCNEEGRLMGMTWNMTLCGVDFVGPVLFVGVRGEEFADLADETAAALGAMLGWEVS